MMKLKSIGFVALAIASVGFFAPVAQAQPQITPENVSDAITNALFNQSGDFYQNAGIVRQATLLFGLSYPENEMTNDAQAVEKIYRQGMQQQSGGKEIRTADLPNPFTSSIRTTPPQAKAPSNPAPKADEPSIAPASEAESPVATPAPRARG